jgi:hypothetical protein
MTDRLPKTIYYEGGYIKFGRHEGKIKFYVWKWLDSTHLVAMKEGIYTGQTKEEMLKIEA